MRDRINKAYIHFLYQILIIFLFSGSASAWFSKTHLAIAKAAGYKNWHNAAAADIAKIKAGNKEQFNHYVNNQKDAVITPAMVMAQTGKYNSPRDRDGHLYGAIIASARKTINDKKEGRYPEDNMAYCVHYVGDLSMPLHNVEFNDFNKKYHMQLDGIIENECLDNISRIKMERITLKTEGDLAREIARIAELSKDLGFRLVSENRMMTKDEAYRQISLSASLLKAMLEYVYSK
jgi:hypothetical protein